MQEKFINYILWIIFQEEFYSFTTNNFKRIRANIRAKLRTYLLKKEIYVAIYNNRHNFSEILFDFFQEEK
jgi:hypothetical protein